jgi:hypothetical protein
LRIPFLKIVIRNSTNPLSQAEIDNHQSLPLKAESKSSHAVSGAAKPGTPETGLTVRAFTL